MLPCPCNQRGHVQSPIKYGDAWHPHVLPPDAAPHPKATPSKKKKRKQVNKHANEILISLNLCKVVTIEENYYTNYTNAQEVFKTSSIRSLNICIVIITIIWQI